MSEQFPGNMAGNQFYTNPQVLRGDVQGGLFDATEPTQVHPVPPVAETQYIPVIDPALQHENMAGIPPQSGPEAVQSPVNAPESIPPAPAIYDAPRKILNSVLKATSVEDLPAIVGADKIPEAEREGWFAALKADAQHALDQRNAGKRSASFRSLKDLNAHTSAAAASTTEATSAPESLDQRVNSATTTTPGAVPEITGRLNANSATEVDPPTGFLDPEEVKKAMTADLEVKYSKMSDDEILTIGYEAMHGSGKVAKMHPIEKAVFDKASQKALDKVHAQLDTLGDSGILLQAEQVFNPSNGNAPVKVSEVMKEILHGRANRAHQDLQEHYNNMPAEDMLRFDEHAASDPNVVKNMSKVEFAMATRRLNEATKELQDKYKNMNNEDVLWLNEDAKKDPSIVSNMSKVERALVDARINQAWNEFIEGMNKNDFKAVQAEYDSSLQDPDDYPTDYREWLSKYYVYRKNEEDKRLNPLTTPIPVQPIPLPKQSEGVAEPEKGPEAPRTLADISAELDQQEIARIGTEINPLTLSKEGIADLTDAQLNYIVDIATGPARFAENRQKYDDLRKKLAKQLKSQKRAEIEKQMQELAEKGDAIINKTDQSMIKSQLKAFQREKTKRENARTNLEADMHNLKHTVYHRKSQEKDENELDAYQRAILGFDAKKGFNPWKMNKRMQRASDMEILKLLPPAKIFSSREFANQVWNRLTTKQGRDRFEALAAEYEA